MMTLLFWGVLVVFLQFGKNVHAQELPSGDILLIYSDSASDEDMKNVMSIVENLTYQSFQVTYASASECVNELEQFSSIICYKLEKFPNELIVTLKQKEDMGNANTSLGSQIRILFVGNEFLRTYLNETGRKYHYINSSYQSGKIKYQFNNAIPKESLVREENFLFLSGDLEYSSGNIEVNGIEGYFCARIGVLTHIPVSDLQNNLIRAAFIKETAQWKWPYNGEPHTYAQYMVLNEVYPFQDSDKLLKIVEYVILQKQPFIITVMPIYLHGDYPAMQRFCEILRYAQANGGTILLHSPINQMPDFDVDIVNEYMTTAVNIYVNQGVYPMGIQVPNNWMFHSETIDIMSHFRTILIAEEKDELLKDTKESNTNRVYKDGHQWIAPAIKLDAHGVSYIKTNSTGVYIDTTVDMETIKDKIRACIDSFVPLKSLWDADHSFWTDEDVMKYKNQIILINGKRAENKFTANKYEDTFTYNRNMLQRYSGDLSQMNKRLMIAVAGISLLFISFIVIARYRNKQTFFVQENKSERKEKWEDGLTEEILEIMLQEDEEQKKVPYEVLNENEEQKEAAATKN